MSVNIEGSVIERLCEWLIAHNKELKRDALSLDFDLIEARAVDSLSSLEFVLFIEELSGREMDMTALKETDNFRTLRSIYNAFLSHLTPAAVADHADHSHDAETLSAAGAKAARDRLGRTASTTRRPLTYSQARYWHLQQVRPESAWNVPAIVRIKGPLDLAVFRKCLGELVRRHDALRITFRVVDGEPVQELVPPFTPEIQTIQLEPGLAEPWQETLRIVERENAHPCELSAGPPWYVRMIHITEDDNVCLLALSKTIADIGSLLTIPKELGKIYASLSGAGSDEVSPPSLQFSDFSDWHEAWLKTDAAKAQIDHRRQQFAGARPLDLGSREGTTRGERESHQRQISLDTTARLEALAADEGATPVAITMAAAATMLYRRFQQRDIVLMNVSTYRTTATDGVVGNFTNQLPLRIKVSDDMSFRDLLRQVRGVIIDAIKHRDLPTEVVFNTDNPLNHPLAAVFVNWINLVDYRRDMTEVRAGETSFEPVLLGSGASNVYGAPFATLIVRAVRNPQGASVRITTDNNVLASGTSASLAQEVGSLLETAALDPDLSVSAKSYSISSAVV